VHARIDNQPTRPQASKESAPNFLVGIAIQSELGPQGFGIKRPALDESGLLPETAEARQRHILCPKLRLQMVAGYAFVQFQHLAGVSGP